MSVHTFETMGTVVSVRVPDSEAQARPSELDEAVAGGQRAFDELDRRFSLYRPDSELSQVARGEIPLASSSEEMRLAYADALEWRNRTNYTFTPHRPDDTVDLSGTVKAMGIEALAHSLHESGFDTFLINAGGDMLASGQPDGGWRVGIANPADPETLVALIELTAENQAVATSGTAERGEHIWRRPDTDTNFVQATVIAEDIMTADVLATTIIAGGQASLDHATDTFGIGALVVLSDGTKLANERFRSLMRSA